MTTPSLASHWAVNVKCRALWACCQKYLKRESQFTCQNLTNMQGLHEYRDSAIAIENKITKGIMKPRTGCQKCNMKYFSINWTLAISRNLRRKMVSKKNKQFCMDLSIVVQSPLNISCNLGLNLRIPLQNISLQDFLHWWDSFQEYFSLTWSYIYMGSKCINSFNTVNVLWHYFVTPGICPIWRRWHI